MNNPTELSVTNVTSPSSTEIILSRTNNLFIEELVDRTIPTDVWEILKSTADANGFAALDIAKQKQSISSKITTALNTFWDDARALEEQGYTITRLNLHIEVKSRLAKTKMTSEIVSTAAGRKSGIVIENFTDDESIIQETRTSFRPEDIPCIVSDVRNDRIPSNLSRNAVNWIKSQLVNNPNWTGDDVERLQTFSSNLELYQLTINPSLFYESPLAEISTTSENADVDTSDITRIIPQTTVEKATPTFRKVMSSKTEVRQGLYRHSLHWESKPKQSNPADIETGLSSLSMNTSNGNT